MNSLLAFGTGIALFAIGVWMRNRRHNRFLVWSFIMAIGLVLWVIGISGFGLPFRAQDSHYAPLNLPQKETQ